MAIRQRLFETATLKCESSLFRIDASSAERGRAFKELPDRGFPIVVATKAIIASPRRPSTGIQHK